MIKNRISRKTIMMKIQAWKLAKLMHKNQKYPGTNLPYEYHLSQVYNIINHTFTESDPLDKEHMILCAILHDIIEDTPITGDDIRKDFSNEIALSVMALTKSKELFKYEALEDSLKRICECPLPKETLAVKLADRIANLSNMPPKIWRKNKVENYILESKMIYDTAVRFYTTPIKPILTLMSSLDENINNWVNYLQRMNKNDIG